MKTNFLPKNRHRVSYKKPIVTIVAIFVLGALFFSFFDGMVIRFFSPLWRGQNAISQGLKNLGDFLKSKEALINENNKLKEMIISKELIIKSFKSPPETSNSLVGVLMHPPQTAYDNLIIDVGLSDGVFVGQSVSLPEGPRIGTLIEIFDKNSRVKLYSANGEKTNAVLERNDVPIILLGRGGGNFEFTLPRDVAIETGDRIFSPDTQPTLIAVVGDIESTPTDAFKKVIASLAVNIYTLRFVIITP